MTRLTTRIHTGRCGACAHRGGTPHGGYYRPPRRKPVIIERLRVTRGGGGLMVRCGINPRLWALPRLAIGAGTG